MLFISIIFFAQMLIAQQQPYHPLRIKNNITLDGKLNEPEWKDAAVENDFMQYDPSAGAAPSEKTEIRILYNDQYLFVGLRAFESHINQLVRYSLQRDFEVGNDDGFAVAIDMYNDKSTGLAFINNILNARWDAELSADGVNQNETYNTFWDVASSIDSSGYSSEFRIPFSSLRFAAKDTVKMGFRIVRLIKHKNEFDIYPRCNPAIEDAYFKVSLAKEMELYHLKTRKPFYITSYIIANYSAENNLNVTGTAYEKKSAFLTRKNYSKNESLDKIISNIGFDIKYGLSKNFTLDVTANTDFAQAEADNVIVNLTKYEVNLPEKRSFFLESQNYLGYGTTTGNQLFISRSIGLENNTLVPIIAGVRLTGKSKGFQMGMLDMQTKQIDEQQIEAHNIFAFRFRKDIDSIGSFAGGMVTNLLNTSNNHHSSQSFGFGVLKKINNQVSSLIAVSGTSVNTNFKKQEDRMNYNFGVFRTAKQGWYYGADIDWVGKGFLPALGYVQENDLLNARINAGYKWQAKEEGKKAYYYLHGSTGYKRKPSLGKDENKFISIETGINFKDGSAIDISPLQYQSDVLFTEWHIADHITIPVGEYKMYSPDINFTLPQKSKYRGNIFLKFLDFYKGNRFTINPNFTYVFNKHLFTTIEYEYDRINFPRAFADNGNALFQSNLLRLSLSYYFNIRFSVKLLTQYDKLGKNISSNLRIRYNPREGTDLYIVINQGLNNERNRLTPKLPLVSNEAVIIKYLKTFTL